MDGAEVCAPIKEDVMEHSGELQTQEIPVNVSAINACDAIVEDTGNAPEHSMVNPDLLYKVAVHSPDALPTVPLDGGAVDGDTVNCAVNVSSPKNKSSECSSSGEKDSTAIQPANESESNVVDRKTVVQSLESEKSKLFEENSPIYSVVTNETLKTSHQETGVFQSVSELEYNALEADNLKNTVLNPALGEALGSASASFKTSSLSLLAAQYDSDSDSGDVYEVPAPETYQNRFVEIDSDTSLSDVEVLSEDGSPINLDILGAGHSVEDDEENRRNSRTPMVKGEFHLDDLPPIQNLHITVAEEECTELGKVQSIIEQLVLVNSLPGTVPLDLETVLFLDKGKQVLGEIFDVLGQVSDPLYCVRFNTNKEIKEKGIVVGQTVYVAPRTQHTQFIVLANLMKERGSDASWENDVEPPERFLDYSDDEDERTARRPTRNRSRPSDADDEAPKRQRHVEPPFPNCGVFPPPPRPYRGNYYDPAGRQPRYQPPSSYNIAGNSWHSNFYQNYAHPHQAHHQYRIPAHPSSGYRGPLSHGPPLVHLGSPATHTGPPPTHPGLVLNPYAMFPPPQLMQQPLFPPPPQQPPPPSPPAAFNLHRD